MQELMSRHKAYALNPRDCLKTTLFQKWQKMVAPPGKIYYITVYHSFKSENSVKIKYRQNVNLFRLLDMFTKSKIGSINLTHIFKSKQNVKRIKYFIS